MNRLVQTNEQLVEMVTIDDDKQTFLKEMRLRKSSGCSQIGMHIMLMVKKNIILFKRNQKTSIFQLISPILVCLLLCMWQKLAESLSKITVIDHPAYTTGKIPKCLNSNGQSRENIKSSFDIHSFNSLGQEDCISIAYGVVGEREEWIDHALNYVATLNDLQLFYDIVEIKIKAPQDFQNFIKLYPNRTQIGIVFCTSNWTITSNITFPCSSFDDIKGYEDTAKGKRLVYYTIFQNWTLFYRSPFLSSIGTNYPKDWVLTQLKIDLDNGIVDYFSKSNEEERLETFSSPLQPKIQLQQQNFPTSPSRFSSGIDVVTGNGAFYFFIPIMINFILTINEIIREKQKKLRQGITTMGLGNFSYWTSWLITSLILSTISSTIQILCGKALRFDIFIKTPFIILLIFLITFGMSISIIGYLIANICSDPSNGYSFAYGFLLMSLVMQFFLTSGVFIYYLHRIDAEFFIQAMKFVFSFYPAFHYSKIYGDIAFKSGKHYSVADSRWVEGVGYNYSDLFEPIQGKFTVPKESFYECPTTFQSFINLNLVTLVYALLALYADIIFPNNRGTQESPFFFLSLEYWSKCFGLKKNENEYKKERKLSFEKAGQQKEYNYNDMNFYNTVSREKQRVKSNDASSSNSKGISIMGLGKTYNKYPFGIKSSKDKQALKDIWFEVDGGECIAILGHNGAGKSTMINILTGLLQETTGTAKMMGLNLKTNMAEIQTLMGVCPQFDILWDELTAEEHLEMYCMLKGVPKYKIQKEINTRLQEVGLFHVKKATIGTYSGGMKRRISLAISAIGNPAIIFLDEPTSGMDPKTRRDVWEMIKVLKQNKAIILTTHAMEEAEALSDRIIVMAGGELKCIGTSLYLKNHYSDGYRLNIVTESMYIDYARIELKKLLPSCKIQDCSGGSIVACVPVLSLNELANFFKIMESGDEEIEVQDQRLINFKKYIKDWGLSHATLEEVFLKITQSKALLL